MNGVCCWSNLEKNSYYNMLYFVFESSDLYENTRACSDPQIKIMARFLLLLLNQSAEQELMCAMNR